MRRFFGIFSIIICLPLLVTGETLNCIRISCYTKERKKVGMNKQQVLSNIYFILKGTRRIQYLYKSRAQNNFKVFHNRAAGPVSSNFFYLALHISRSAIFHEVYCIFSSSLLRFHFSLVSQRMPLNYYRILRMKCVSLSRTILSKIWL